MLQLSEVEVHSYCRGVIGYVGEAGGAKWLQGVFGYVGEAGGAKWLQSNMVRHGPFGSLQTMGRVPQLRQ